MEKVEYVAVQDVIAPQPTKPGVLHLGAAIKGQCL